MEDLIEEVARSMHDTLQSGLAGVRIPFDDARVLEGYRDLMREKARRIVEPMTPEIAAIIIGAFTEESRAQVLNALANGG